jgi:hypothetical protein
VRAPASARESAPDMACRPGVSAAVPPSPCRWPILPHVSCRRSPWAIRVACPTPIGITCARWG